MPDHARTPVLSRTHIKRGFDKPTNSVVLEYIGRTLKFHDRLYGFPEKTFLVVSKIELPYPPRLVELSAELNVPLDVLHATPALKEAAIEAIVADAMVNAPELLLEMSEPETRWQNWDLRDLEKKHVIAMSRLAEVETLAENELRLRSSSSKIFSSPVRAPTVAVAVAMVPEPEPQVVAVSPAPPPPLPDDTTTSRIQEATTQARAKQLPQRLPSGARRALQKLARALYVVHEANAPVAQSDLAMAMQFAEAAARAADVGEVEVTVIDWDGEWPVVVRRYGDDGRIVYRVEDALKRGERSS